MPLFVVIGHDVPDSKEKRKQARPAHLARIDKLNDAGKVILGGPCPEEHGSDAMTGSILVLDFDTKADLETWLKDEPYLKEGVYSHVDIKPFIQGYPK